MQNHFFSKRVLTQLINKQIAAIFYMLLLMSPVISAEVPIDAEPASNKASQRFKPIKLFSTKLSQRLEKIEPSRTEASNQVKAIEPSRTEASDQLMPIELSLRVHIMRDITFQAYSKGELMTNDHINSAIVYDELIPELNKIWSLAGISWAVESIVEESAIKPNNFVALKKIVEHAERNDEGRSDSRRLEPLYQFMDPEHKSTEKELFHVYIFPFIGNASQGNAMRDYDWHMVVGSWSNKHNRGGQPIARANTEDHNQCVLGSLGRTIAHELGHVLGLNHEECTKCLMSDCGYDITTKQISVVRSNAKRRIGF